MIQVSFPTVRTITYKSRHARIINIENGISGETTYTYEITVTLSTQNVLANDCNSVMITAIPFKTPDSAKKINASELLTNKQHFSQRQTHLDAHNQPYSISNESMGGTLSAVQKNAIKITTSVPKIDSNFPVLVGSSKISKNESVLYSILNFERALASSVNRNLINRRHTKIDNNGKSILGYIDEKAKNSIILNSIKLKETIGAKSRNFFSKNSDMNYESFYTSDVQFKLVNANRIKNKSSASKISSMTTVVNNLPVQDGSRNGRLGQNFSRNSYGNVTQDTQNTTNTTRQAGYQKGIQQFSHDVGSSQVGSTQFNKSSQDASFNAIFIHGVSPTMLIPVNVDHTIVSPMQNYQGISNLKNNGF
jgi:hypothetical protein